MILELAIGDAYGRPFEFCPLEFIDDNNKPDAGYARRSDRDVDDGLDAKDIGYYTDDTQMTIAIAQHMLSGRFHPSSIHYASRFLHTYKRDQRGGYSKRLKKALQESDKPLDFMEHIMPSGMSSNGSVMRTVPLGLIQDPALIISHCISHTSTTHCTVHAINSAIIISLTAHYLYHELGTEYDDYVAWLKTHMDESVVVDLLRAYYETPSTGVPCDARITASWCIKLCWESNSYMQLLKNSVELGGDVDSIAAVSMGLAALKNFNINRDVLADNPLFVNLENGTYGRDFIISLDNELFSRYPKIPKDGSNKRREAESGSHQEKATP